MPVLNPQPYSNLRAQTYCLAQKWTTLNPIPEHARRRTLLAVQAGFQTLQMFPEGSTYRTNICSPWIRITLPSSNQKPNSWILGTLETPSRSPPIQKPFYNPSKATNSCVLSTLGGVELNIEVYATPGATGLFIPKAQNGPNTLYNMVFRPKSLKLWVLRALGL